MASFYGSVTFVSGWQEWASLYGYTGNSQ